ncbi:hypothetical protein [Ferrimonas balearica]|uniref:hypothetical protein n=1 Tax=Ferrimonas balearica TaxID=44012 RepID=UPI001C9A0E39|nr:hypothetical protein [Ferrimonas balearica]MBY5993420.1 hypothetical protein [Ferrimonas balearica]
MKKVLIAGFALLALPVMANHYGGVQFYDIATKSKAETKVLAQADSIEALQQQLMAKGESEQDINALLRDSPTAAGGDEGTRIEAKRVVDRCYYSFQAVACSTKVVYQVIE